MKYIETSPKRLKTTFDSLILLIALIVFSQQKDTLKQGAPFEEFLINDVANDKEYTNPEQPWFISNANEFFVIPNRSCNIQALVGKGFDGD